LIILSEEHRLRVLRRIFGPRRDEITGKENNNEKLNDLTDLYSSPSIIWVIK